MLSCCQYCCQDKFNNFSPITITYNYKKPYFE
ncbi:hypothetical protein CAEBREN_05448 [Caenorhabditis brenneri]|uniref:Uncharacterized protein n=1 Tax=Caenorhabditis brenneri TaxID=135651 RepID=G0PBI9_CAEBE|nr:hypothetical protein CAEBREN_05448 [Caenorhabditis brenneri]